MAIGGILFALATAPGPIVHDHLVGRGTWLAGELTKLWGDGRPLVPHHRYAPVTAMLSRRRSGCRSIRRCSASCWWPRHPREGGQPEGRHG